jgi:hypothetical protein
VRLLYLSADDDLDGPVSEQIAGLSKQLIVATVNSLNDAVSELRKADADYRALIISPALSEHHVLTAIGAVRRQRVAVPILPVLREQVESKPFVNGGASDVLVMSGDQLVNARETLAATTHTPSLAVRRDDVSKDGENAVAGAARKTAAGIRQLFSSFNGPDDELPDPMGREELEFHLKQIRAEADRILGEDSEKPESADAEAGVGHEDSSEPVVQEPAPRRPSAERSQPAANSTRKQADTVDGIRLELARVLEEHAYERAAWEKTFQELRSGVSESRATESNPDLEAQLEEARASLQQAVEHNRAERAAWEATRQQLEARLNQRGNSIDQAEFDSVLSNAIQAETNRLREKLDGALAEIEAYRTKIRGKLASERTAWETARQQLEAAAGTAKTELEQTVARHATELEALKKALRDEAEARAKAGSGAAHAEPDQSAAEAFAAERATWDSTRQELESTVSTLQAELKKTGAMQAAELRVRTKELHEAREARMRQEATLEESQAAQKEATERLAAERSAWETTRKEIEASVKAAQSELKESARRHAAELAIRTKEQQELSARAKELQELSDARAKEVKELSEARARDTQELSARASEVQELSDARTTLEGALDSTRAELAHEVEGRHAERTAARASRELLEARVNELQAATQARDKLESALAVAREELQEAAHLHAAERAIWEASRQLRETLERDIQAILQDHGGENGRPKGTEKDPELLDAYRALEARLRETSNRLHLVRRGSDRAQDTAEPESEAVSLTERRERARK